MENMKNEKVELFGNRNTGVEVAVKSHGIFERSLMIN
jgi:hypothetical protein